jgi:hypothetical protein
MPESYWRDKWIWNDADFEQMGWHDVRIHAMAFRREGYDFALDIDYMLEWVHPAEGETYYRFWIAPASLVFENVSSMEMDLASMGSFTILHLERGERTPTRAGFEGPAEQWLWTLECLEGVIELRATGFRQIIRRAPVLASSQVLDEVERGGISFSEEPGRPAKGSGSGQEPVA